MAVIEIGHYCLVLACAIALFQSGGIFPQKFSANIIIKACRVHFLLLSLSFLSLIYAYVVSDFSVVNVVNNSHTDKPLLYKITGAWGNHEGSMLLWALILSLFGFLMSHFTFTHTQIQSRAIAIQGAIGFLVLLFITITSSPFERVFPPLDNGQDLNPLLQDIGLAIHPPLLYGGYVGFSAVFSIALSCLLSGTMGRQEGKIIHHWCRVAWIFLTMGIGLGMWWAYYELGWGGFWFWDPVENASLMPWLAGTALLHSAIIVTKRGILKHWVILLSIFTFSTSLLGTFIVRSGIITSVHSFASSPERGIFILGITVICVGFALISYCLYGYKLRDDDNSYHLFSKEGALILNNYLLSGILLIVLTGTLYPPFLESLTGQKISVGAPYFNSSIAPLFYILVVLMPISGFVAWKKGYISHSIKPLTLSILFIGFLLLGIILFKLPKDSIIPLLCAFWIIIGSITEIILRSGGNIRKILEIFSCEMPKFSAHIGLGLVIIGITGITVLGQQKSFVVDKNQTISLANHDFQMINEKIFSKDNYKVEQITIQDTTMGEKYFPERRFYPTRQQTTTEADIHLFWNTDVYVTSGGITEDNKRHINIRIHPYAGFLWGGILCAIIGGLCGLFYQRKNN